MCTHCSFWNFVFVKYCLQIFSCLGTRVADWYIPFLTSWTPVSHEYTFSYVLSKSLHTNKAQKSSTQMQALIFPVLPCLSRVLPAWQMHFCSASVTSTERYCVFVLSPTPFFSVQKVTVITDSVCTQAAMPPEHCAPMQWSENLDKYHNLQLCHSGTKLTSALMLQNIRENYLVRITWWYLAAFLWMSSQRHETERFW